MAHIAHYVALLFLYNTLQEVYCQDGVVITVVTTVVQSPPPPTTSGGHIVGAVSAGSDQGATANDTVVQLEIDATKDLYDELFSSYEPLLRPRLDLADTVVVTTKFVPITIMEFDTRDQIFTISGYFIFEWRDEVLANASSFNGTVKIASSGIWIPPVRILKMTSDSTYVGDKTVDILAIRNNGSVQWVPEDIYSIICEVNIKFYPFDEQICTFTYYIEGETTSEVDLNYYGHVDLTEYIPNAEWDLISATQETTYKDNVTHIDLHFKVKRRGLFEVTTIVGPVIVMSLLSGFAFLLPISSGEKGGIAIAMFFAYTIFMTVMIDSLPHNSLHVSYLVLFVLYLLSGSILLIGYSILQHKIYSDLISGTCPSVCKRLVDRCVQKRTRQAENADDWERLFRKMDSYIFVGFFVVNFLCAGGFMYFMFTQNFLDVNLNVQVA